LRASTLQPLYQRCQQHAHGNFAYHDLSVNMMTECQHQFMAYSIFALSVVQAKDPSDL
jgi:hypothetical protein